MTEAAPKELAGSLRRAWARDTSSDPARWTPENPAWGQCAVTSCIVQDALGGEIVWAEAQTPKGEKISHYFNKLANGSTLDLTREQFPEGTTFTPPEGEPKTKTFATTRDYVLSFPATQKRYDKLKHALQG